MAPSVGFQGKHFRDVAMLTDKAAPKENKRFCFDMLTSLLFLNSQRFQVWCLNCMSLEQKWKP